MDLLKNNVSIDSYVKNSQTIKLNTQLLNHQNNTQKYFITEAPYYRYSKVSKTILFAIFGFTDFKLLQIYSNTPFGIWII